MRRLVLLIAWLVSGLSGALAAQPQPLWVWGETTPANELRFFRREIFLPSRPRKAVLAVACDSQAIVSVNDQGAGKNDAWNTPSEIDITRFLRAGANTLGIMAQNDEGPAGLLARLEVTLGDGAIQTLVSDKGWETSPNGATDWIPARELGAHGMAPWGVVFKGRTATDAATLKTLPGFSVELIRSAQTGEGSWVSLAFDPKGRLWISPQGSEPLLRASLTNGQVAALDPIATPARGAMGLLWAFDSLYVNGRGTNGLALYRLTDTNADDTFDTCVLLRTWRGDGGEHGPHGLTADASHVYVINGNFVDVPGDLAASSPVRGFADDVVLPRLEDANGFGTGRKPPGGFILRMNPDGSTPELFSGGQRNAYDLAFNEDGELFTFDSDMEGDWGLPWYRPTRVLHCFAGAEHGFREGSAKWPADHADSMPAVADIGIGSPTGIANAVGAKFPHRYRRALFMMDWSFGRILAVHLRPHGATYTADFETFLQGRALNVTDLAVGPDGAMYFITGGRGTQSGLYRVTYTGTDPGATQPLPAPVASAEHSRRRELGELARAESPDALARLWPSLGSADHALRFAARVALERQPLESWKERALGETNAAAGLTALLALARYGNVADQAPLLRALGRWPLDTLPDDLFLLKLRTIEVSVARHGLPEPALQKLAIDKLGRQFPGRSWPINRELVQLLVAFGAPDVVARALDLRDTAATLPEAVHYQAVLRLAREGWTTDLRKRYFAWFHRRPRYGYSPAFLASFRDVGQKPATGMGFDSFLRTIRQQAVVPLPDAEKGELAAWITGAALTNAATAATLPPAAVAPKRPARTFVKAWKAEDLAARIATLSGVPARGRAIYDEAQCALCHRFAGEGGAVGPDLTGAGTRYSRADLVRSLVEPSAVISEQYQAHVLTRKNGETLSGRITGESAIVLAVLVDPINGVTLDVPKADLQSREASKVSPMPEGLLNPFTPEDIADLLAYLQAP